MKYQKNYKYQLYEDEYFADTGIKGYSVDTFFIKLLPGGQLLIKKGYAWDGPSGPTYDTENSMTASLLHDALYQLMREEYISPATRSIADKLLDRILKLKGMWAPRRWYWLKGVVWFAGGAAEPEAIRKVYTV
jgi:hypothetical protein